MFLLKRNHPQMFALLKERCLLATVVIIILNVRLWSWALLSCVWKLPKFSKDQSVHLRTQQRGSAEKSGLRDVKRPDFIRHWRRSGLKNSDKPKIFMKKNVRNHSYHQFHPVLAKIRIDRGLLYKQHLRGAWKQLQKHGCCWHSFKFVWSPRPEWSKHGRF